MLPTEQTIDLNVELTVILLCAKMRPFNKVDTNLANQCFKIIQPSQQKVRKSSLKSEICVDAPCIFISEPIFPQRLSPQYKLTFFFHSNSYNFDSTSILYVNENLTYLFNYSTPMYPKKIIYAIIQA